MYSHYNGYASRSKSTTDVYQGSNELHDDASYPPTVYGTFKRPCKVAIAPKPPNRTTSQPQRDDATIAPSKNFVKRLVEALERRQREQQEQQQVKNIGKPADRELYEICNSKREERAKVADRIEKIFSERKPIDVLTKVDRAQLPKRRMTLAEDRPPALIERTRRLCAEHRELPAIRVNATQLEDVYERDENTSDDDDDDDDDDDVSYCNFPSEPSSSYFETKKADNYWRALNDGSSTINPIASKAKPIKSTAIDTARRRIRNALTSLKNWRLGAIKGLPKGTRAYYATRESLGDELCAFRRDTMPQLLEQSCVGQGLRAEDVEEEATKDRAMEKEFVKYIGSPSMMEDRPMSTATIHPKHCRYTRYTDVARVSDEFVYGSRKVDPPTVPPPPIPETQLVRSYNDVDDTVQLRRFASSSMLSSPTTSSQSSSLVSVIYDVPRSITPINETSTNFSDYVNVNVDTVDERHLIGDDKRLYCTNFTTF